jgi:DNA repair protein RadC
VQTARTSTLILRSPHDHATPILHINTEDVSITRQIVEAGKLLDVDVLDHLIIGQQRYVSLKERGLGFA